ncbi:hypothetical protein QUA20_16195 [Microcoleus sp. Pol7_A1]|uniref:hypothetical protein n=1 Tax=Microcoleus sp. Pol7_A1 TaxID=2818893 RepID=UPI002FD17879
MRIEPGYLAGFKQRSWSPDSENPSLADAPTLQPAQKPGFLLKQKEVRQRSSLRDLTDVTEIRKKSHRRRKFGNGCNGCNGCEEEGIRKKQFPAEKSSNSLSFGRRLLCRRLLCRKVEMLNSHQRLRSRTTEQNNYEPPRT